MDAGPGLSGKSLMEVAPCNTEACCPECSESVDCVWGPWDDWSSCPVSCGGGETTRFRDILTMGKANGKPCSNEDSFEIAACSPDPCLKKEYPERYLCPGGAGESISGLVLKKPRSQRF